MSKSRLSAAYHGYIHQDVVTAYALATLLLPRPDTRMIVVERKVVQGDKFDDLELVGSVRNRIQVKAHQGGQRPLRLRDFTTSSSIDFRIDEAVRSVTEDRDPADMYRLFTTYNPPEEELLPFLKQDQTIPPMLPGLPTQRFRLDLDSIWPSGDRPSWPHVHSFDREALAWFCQLFVVEIECPQSSADLRSPGSMDNALLDLLHDRIGVGRWPNHNRNLADAAAHLIYTAHAARSASVSLASRMSSAHWL